MSVSFGFNAGGTGVVVFTFENENGEPTIPVSAKWSLLRGGKYVNNKENQELSGISSPEVEIYLSGDDLVGGEQYIVVEGEYNSVSGGTLPFREWKAFEVFTPPHPK